MRWPARPILERPDNPNTRPETENGPTVWREPPRPLVADAERTGKVGAEASGGESVTRRLTRLLQIRAGEETLVLLGAVFFLLVQAGQVFAVNAADALLFQRFGVDVLPTLFVVLGAASLITTTAYASVLGRPNRVGLSLWVLAGVAAAGVLGWAATFIAKPSLYPALWLAIALANGVVGTLLWVLAGEVCDPRQAKRLFSLFASAGILGSVAAGFLTGPAARFLGTAGLLILFAALMLTGAAVGRVLIARHGRPAAAGGSRLSPLAELRRAHGAVFSNPTMRWTAISAVLFSILFFSLTFPFNAEVAAAFPDEARLAGFLGTFGGVVTAVTFAVSLLAASRLYASIGIIGAILLLPAVYLGGFLLWAIRLDLTTATVVRFLQLVVLGGLASTAYSALFNVVPADRRASVRAYLSGPPAQLGVILSGVLLLLGQRGLTAAQALAIGMMVAAATAAIVWRMRRTYGESLVLALRQGITDVFTAAEGRFLAVRGDSQARSVAEQGLKDPRPAVRQTSLAILAELGVAQSVAAIAGLRLDESPEVRRAAVAALGRADSRQASAAAREFLGDGDPGVRAEAVLASGTLTDSDVEDLVRDPSPRVRARVAIVLHRGGETQRARQIVEALLSEAAESARLEGLRACAEVLGVDAAPKLVAGLREGAPLLRLEAARALGAAPTREGLDALVEALDDPDGRVRRAAGQALGRAAPVDRLVAVLDGGSARAQEEALEALAGRGGEARQAVLAWSARQIEEAERLRAYRTALASSGNGRAAEALAGFLTRSERETERRILRGLSGADSAQAMRTVARALRSKDPDLRAQAVEALASIGDRRVARSLIRLMEADDRAPTVTVEKTLHELSRHPRPWFRALALRARAEAIRAQWRHLAQASSADPAPLVRRAVGADTSGSPGGEMIETRDTLGIVERVLFLRQVPIFRWLEPEDLERIASLARERLHAPGDFLCREGEVGDELFVLVDGSVEVSKDSGGTSHRLRTLSAGEHLGELAILREQPRSASVRALVPTRTLVLDGAALRSILEDRPQVGLAMLESLAERMSTLG